MHETIFVVHKQLCVQRDSPAVGRCNLVFFVKVFSLLTIHLLGVHNTIWADVDSTPLSNFKYSRWHPRWPPQRTKKSKNLICQLFFAIKTNYDFNQTCVAVFNEFQAKYLRTITYPVSMVTDHMTSNKHENSCKIGQISTMTL